MKRETAFKGFYSNLKQCKLYEAQAIKEGHSCNVATAWKMAEMRVRRYAKSLVFEHDYQDIHTNNYCRK